MKRTMIIFKKEMLDTLRDRRTIFMMIVLPLIVMPLLINVFTSLSRSQSEKARQKVLTVAMVDNGNAQTFYQMLTERKDIMLKANVTEDKTESLVKEGILDFAIVFDKEFDRTVAEKGTGSVRVILKSSSETEITKKRILKLLDEYEKQLLGNRLNELQLQENFVDPFTVAETDMASAKEKIGEYIGGFLPYLFVIFCFTGSMYPAIDLAAGEKERATLETLLSSPARRMDIVAGKFMVIVIAGLVSAVLGIASLLISVKTMSGIPDNFLSTISRMIEFQSVVLVLSLLVPLCVFFASMQLAISLFAKSFKEAQSIMTPLYFVVFFPVLIGMIPGIKLNTATAFVPILNVSLATKEIMSGHIPTGLLVITYASLFILAAASLVFCVQWFKREDVIFRGI